MREIKHEILAFYRLFQNSQFPIERGIYKPGNKYGVSKYYGALH